MPTQLSKFCQHFDATLRPFLTPVNDALGALAEAGEGSAAALRPSLEDLRHQLESLVDKVRDQQAYVLIFGPLKSGKSTLMNSLAAAYVSEVSSLPAYPCLVFVGDGGRRRFEITTYDGQREEIDATDAMHARIGQAHAELAEAMRHTEQAGEDFDPQEHFPRAIRRIDVRMPAAALARSGAVLVDTPGLYTRMRFGYDRMTRDFRNAAACAVFVVKTDNLFLEQVFAEFNELLALFSRIFLVVNMDTTKRDVGPDGRLIPSLEKRSPTRILEAFENLAMSTPLKQALDDGRLRLHPVDLLHAASAVLGGGGPVPEDFARFRDELEDYLASADYLVAFLGDSLRRAAALVGETGRLTVSDTAETLRHEHDATRRERADAEEEVARLEEALQADWSGAFAASEDALTAEVERSARDQGARMARTLGASIDTWFLSSHGLHWLLDGQWRPAVRDFVSAVEAAARHTVSQSSAASHGGLDLDATLRDLLADAGVAVAEVRRRALEDAAARPSPAPELPVHAGNLPIKRGVLDLLAFRGRDQVREKLFGPRERPDTRISARTKSTRLGEPAKMFLRDHLLTFRKQAVAHVAAQTLERYRDGLRRATVDELRAALRDRLPALREHDAHLRSREQRLAAVLTPLDALHAAAEDLRSKVHALSRQYANTAPDALLDPGAGPVLEPRAPRHPAEDRAERTPTGRTRRRR